MLFAVCIALFVLMVSGAPQTSTSQQPAQTSYVVASPKIQKYQEFQPRDSDTDPILNSSVEISAPSPPTTTYPHVYPQHVRPRRRAPRWSSVRVPTTQYTQPGQVQAQYNAHPKPLVKEYRQEVVQSPAPQWAILRQSADNNFDGHFQYDFETENGIALNAGGAVKQLSPEVQAQVIHGSYSYTAPDGRLIITTYTADENGFVVQGDHLPVAPEEPELPPLIAKSLAYIRSLPPLPENQE